MRGASLSESAIKDKVISIYYGESKNGVDLNLITYDDQFLLGLNKFKGMYTQLLQAAGGGPDLFKGDVLLLIPVFFHCHKKLFVYVSECSIDKAIYCPRSCCIRLEIKFQAVRFIK